jgi:hypothetical protein
MGVETDKSPGQFRDVGKFRGPQGLKVELRHGAPLCTAPRRLASQFAQGQKPVPHDELAPRPSLLVVANTDI